MVRRLPIGVSLTDIAADSAQPRRSSGGVAFRVFRLSHVGADPAAAGLVWPSIRCDAPRFTHVQTLGLKTALTSFHAPREPQQSTRLDLPHDKSYSRSKDETPLMRLPSDMGRACAPTAAMSLKFTRVGGCTRNDSKQQAFSVLVYLCVRRDLCARLFIFRLFTSISGP